MTYSELKERNCTLVNRALHWMSVAAKAMAYAEILRDKFQRQGAELQRVIRLYRDRGDELQRLRQETDTSRERWRGSLIREEMVSFLSKMPEEKQFLRTEPLLKVVLRALKRLHASMELHKMHVVETLNDAMVGQPEFNIMTAPVEERAARCIKRLKDQLQSAASNYCQNAQHLRNRLTASAERYATVQAENLRLKEELAGYQTAYARLGKTCSLTDQLAATTAKVIALESKLALQRERCATIAENCEIDNVGEISQWIANAIRTTAWTYEVKRDQKTENIFGWR